MAKPLGEKFRKGGRNAAFFPQLSGLARALVNKWNRQANGTHVYFLEENPAWL